MRTFTSVALPKLVRVAALGVVTVALVASCSKGATTTATGGPSTTKASTATTVPKLVTSSDLSDILLSANDVGSAWQQEAETELGSDEKGSSANPSVDKTTMTCDGKKVDVKGGDVNVNRYAAAFFDQRGVAPFLYAQLVSAKPATLTKVLADTADVLGGCDKLEVTDSTGTSAAQVQQFAFPPLDLDEQYAFQVTYSLGGFNLNEVDVFARKGSVLMQMQYTSIDQPDISYVAELAGLQAQKL